nr:EAL domain-containing protein [uncultured Desulfobacter sp.]
MTKKSYKFKPLRDKIVSALIVLEKLPFFIVIQRSLAIVLPLIMVGAFSLSIRYFPFAPVISILDKHVGMQWTHAMDNLISGTMGIVSLAVLCTFSGVMTMFANQTRRGTFISPVMSIVVVMSCFFVIFTPADNASWESVFSIGKGLLPTLCVAIAGCTLFLRLSRFKFLRWSLGAVGHDPVVRDILTVLPAGVLTIVSAALLRGILNFMDITDVHAAIRNLLFLPFTDVKNGLGFGLSYTALSQFFWLFGAHGPNLLFAVEENILVPAIHANNLAISQGLNPDLIFTKTFFDMFTRMGGSGSTLCLIAAVLLRSKDKGIRKLCEFAAVPAFCNVNEPLLFGIPLVLNPVYIIPFIITPLLQTIIGYGATVLGFLPFTTEIINWTTPIFISGYVASGNLSGAVVQGVNFAIGVACYVPFVILADHLREIRGERMLATLKNAALNQELRSKTNGILDLPGEEGRFAKAIADDLKSAVKQTEQIYMVYQPQIAECGQFVSGVEALLRWKHPIYGEISPELTVTIAEELGIMNHLGLLIFSKGCQQRAAWKGIVEDRFSMAVNIVPQQLTDPNFQKNIFEIIKQNGLTPETMELEITESNILEPDENTLKTLQRLRHKGIRIAIDDFGMGHTSFRYLHSFPVSKIKIDRSLTIEDARKINDEIIKSVLELGKTLKISTIIEGVETQEQLARFINMGCANFQGYFFSRPLTAENCIAFIRDYSVNPQIA